MDNLSYIIGRNSAGGGSGSTPSWSDVTGKPFNTIGAGLEVSSGALKEVVPLYTESSGQTYGPGMKIIGFSGNSITIAGSDEVAIFAADTNYTVTAKSEGTIYTGSWNSTTNTWLDTANGFTYSIAAGGKGVDYTFTVGALNSVDWVLVEPIDPNEANLTEANVQLIGSGNITWTTVDESTTVVHQLPAQYVPIDNVTLVNDNGTLKLSSAALTPYATESYVNTAITPFITESALTPYVQASSLATVATSGLYSDLSGAPTIPVPDNSTIAYNQSDKLSTVIGGGYDIKNINYSFDINAVGNKELTDSAALALIQGLDIGQEVNWNLNNNDYTCVSFNENTNINFKVYSYGIKASDNKLCLGYVPAENKVYAYINVSIITGETYTNTLTATNAKYVLKVNDKFLPEISVDLPIEKGAGTNAAIIANSNFNTGATGNNSVCIIRGTATGQNAVCLNGWAAGGQDSLSWGNNSLAYGNNSAAFGYGNITRGNGNIFIGNSNGSQNMSMPDYSYAFGQGLYEQPSTKAIVRGYYNSMPTPTTSLKYVDMVGCGSDNNNRANAEATDWSGNKYLAGDIYLGVANWATPTLGAAKIPKAADFSWAEANNLVVDPDAYAITAQDIVDSGQTDGNGNPEYLGVNADYRFNVNVEYNGTKTYSWVCVAAEPVPNPDYDDGGEPEPEEEPEG